MSTSALFYLASEPIGEIVRQDERYLVSDCHFLNQFVLSQTRLEPNRSTTGHSHDDKDEVYFFVQGTGKIELDGSYTDVINGSVVLIKAGVFHRVHNTHNLDTLVFNTIFTGNRDTSGETSVHD